MRSVSYLAAMISLKHWNRRRGPSEQRERRWSLQSMTRWTLLKLPSKSCSLPQRQKALFSNILGTCWIQRKEEKGGGRETPLLGWVDVMQSWRRRHHDSFACNLCHWWLLSERHRCVVAWHWRTGLADGPCGSWTTWCIQQAKFPHWTSFDRSLFVSMRVSLAERSVKVWLVSITSQEQIEEGNLLASQRRIGSSRTYLCPRMAPSSLPSNSRAKGCLQTMGWWTVSCPKNCGHREVYLISIQVWGCNNHTSFAFGTIQGQKSGGREASSDQSNTGASYLTHQHCGYEGQKL